MARRLAVCAVALLTAALFAAVASAADGTSYTIYIHRDGTVEAVIKGHVEPGLNEFPVPAPPIPETIAAKIDGTSIAVIYEEGKVYVASDRNATVEITYMVNTTETSRGLEFQVYNETTSIVIEPSVVLLNLPEGVLNASTTEDGGLLLVVRGPSRIVFLPATPPATGTATGTQTSTGGTKTTAPTTAPPQTVSTPTPGETATGTGAAHTTPGQAATTAPGGGMGQATAPPATSGAAGQAPQTQRGGGGQQATYIAAAAIVIAAAAAAALLARRRPGAGSAPRPGGAAEGGGPSLAPPGLDDTDRLILETLERHGGTMLQSELQRATGLPKTTLWRHVRRLAEQGYIEIVREGKANRLVLKRTPGGRS